MMSLLYKASQIKLKAQIIQLWFWEGGGGWLVGAGAYVGAVSASIIRVER